MIPGLEPVVVRVAVVVDGNFMVWGLTFADSVCTIVLLGNSNQPMNNAREMMYEREPHFHGVWPQVPNDLSSTRMAVCVPQTQVVQAFVLSA
jgi:hypothetical protein